MTTSCEGCAIAGECNHTKCKDECPCSICIVKVMCGNPCNTWMIWLSNDRSR